MQVRPEDLGDAQRRSEDRATAVMLGGFLLACVALTAADPVFGFFVLEAACCVVYIAIFLFTFSIRGYAGDQKSLAWGVGFLFAFLFEAAGAYLNTTSSSPALAFTAVGTYFWVCAQWFQGFSFLMILNRNHPVMRARTAVIVCTSVAVVLAAFYVVARPVVTQWETTYHTVYTGVSAVSLTLFSAFLVARLIRRWNEQPRYFAVRTLVALIVTAVAVAGLCLASPSLTWVCFGLTYLRFVGLSLAYNANVTFTLLSPYRTLYGQLAARADEREKLLHELEERIRNNSELNEALDLLHQTQEKLVQAAKLAASGQLVAGISHDLNTPLAAIQSSAGMLRSVVAVQETQVLTPWEKLDAAQRRLFARLLGVLASPGPLPDSAVERTARGRFEAEAREAGRSEPRELAHLAVQLGLAAHPEAWSWVLEQEDGLPVLRTLEPLATVRQLAEVIHHAAQRATSVVGALQTFLRSGDQGQRQMVDLERSVQDVLPLFLPQKSRGVELVVNLVPVLVSGWPEKLAQVWVNLITNAFQAAYPRGKVEVTVSAGEEAVVSVANTGPVVPPEIRERIFDPFFTTKPAGEGTGLGLYVCRRVVEELDGRLTLESRPGRTVFTVRLPRVVSPGGTPL